MSVYVAEIERSSGKKIGIKRNLEKLKKRGIRQKVSNKSHIGILRTLVWGIKKGLNDTAWVRRSANRILLIMVILELVVVVGHPLTFVAVESVPEARSKFEVEVKGTQSHGYATTINISPAETA